MLLAPAIYHSEVRAMLTNFKTLETKIGAFTRIGYLLTTVICSHGDRKRTECASTTCTTTLIVALTLTVRKAFHIADSNGHWWWACPRFSVLLGDVQRNREKQQYHYNDYFPHNSERVLKVHLLAKVMSDSKQDLLVQRTMSIHYVTDAEENALSWSEVW